MKYVFLHSFDFYALCFCSVSFSNNKKCYKTVPLGHDIILLYMKLILQQFNELQIIKEYTWEYTHYILITIL